MQTISFELPKLLRLIRENRFQIPQFQRPFRWRTNQVKLLVDSLIRSYPVGSLLVMGKNPEMPLKARTIEASIAADESSDFTIETEVTDDIKETYLVLDGQQRLTSIARVLLNADPKRSYYFDLKEMLSTFGGNSSDDDELPWIKAYTKGKRDPERKKKESMASS